MKIAIIGGGVAGIVAAYILSRKHQVTIFEAEDYLGGHTNTITINNNLAIDTGFIVCNNRNYPYFYKFLEQLEVPLRDAEMSFGFYCEQTKLQYKGPAIKEFILEPKNFINFKFLKMLLEQGYFNKKILTDLNSNQLKNLPLGEYLNKIKVSNCFVNTYLKPLIASIWSSPDNEIFDFPVQTLAQFFNNHGMLQLSKRPQWQTVIGGSHSYVKAFKNKFNGVIKLDSKVIAVMRNDVVTVRYNQNNEETFDKVILATHADQALKLLSKPSVDEQNLLGAWKYQANSTILHTDSSIMPPKRRLWAAWNYVSKKSNQNVVSITYYMNKLQGLKTNHDYFVSLNQESLIDPKKIIYKTVYTHPQYTLAAVLTQEKIKAINGTNNTYFCGSYLKYGFHEDAVSSSLNVAKCFDFAL